VGHKEVILKKLKHSLLALLIILGLCALASPVSALDVDSTRDNDTNAVISGGCLTINECQQKFTSDTSVINIFSCFHITAADMKAMVNTAVVGQVTTNNTVLVDGKVVATHAVTAGRQNIDGSTRSSCGNFPFFIRPPSVSFTSNRLTAFVVMDSNDQFDFAILTSCGNPVMATPVKVKVAPPAATTPAAPTQTQQQQQQQTVVINSTQPAVQQQQQATPAAPTQTQTQVTPAAATQLPNTGPGAIAGISLLASGLGTVGHFLYQRFRKI
jgi:hypothetical protein